MKAHRPDYILISTVFVLIFLGMIILSSASVVLSQDVAGENYYFLKHQLIYGFGIGLIGFLIAQRISYNFWQKISFPLVVISLIVLSLVFIPKLGFEHSGAKRWLNLGIFSIQPFEFVKITFILYLSAILARKGKSEEIVKKSLMPISVIVGLLFLILHFQPNMSAMGIIFLLTGLIYFLARMKMTYIFGLAGLILFSFWISIKSAPYRLSRWTIFLHPELDPQGQGYQIKQALLAIGSGGLFGLGLGHSIQKWKYLPEPIGDSIFAIAAEELGLVGAGIIVFLFVFLAWRGIQIARKAPDKFGFLLASGITGWFFFQAFINMAAISGFMPLTGMPLPFISYGGSAMVASLIGVGILTNISKYTK